MGGSEKDKTSYLGFKMKEEIEFGTLSEKGQLVIPRHLRENLHWEKGTKVSMAKVDEDSIVIKRIDTDAWQKEFDKLRAKAKRISEAEIVDIIRGARKEKKGKISS